MSYKIAILGTRGIPNRYGGFEQLAEYLAPGLVRAGHAVTVYNSSRHPFRGAEWKGVRIIRCQDPGRWLGTAGQFMYDLHCLLDARRRRYDVILQLGYTSSSVWGGFFPRDAVTLYHMDGLEWKRSKYVRPVRWFLRWAERLAVAYGDRHISDSPVIRDYLKTKYGLESEYIAYGAERFEQADESVLSQYNVKAGDYYVIMARMEPENHIQLVLDGFAGTVTSRKILVIGETSNEHGRYLRNRFGGDGRIVFVGGLYDKGQLHALKYYSYLYFHGHSTGGTNPGLLEAMASEALIAAHDNAFNRAVLSEGGLYFSGIADVRRLVDMELPVLRSTLTAANIRKVQTEYDWEEIIAHYERFIRSSVMNQQEKKAGCCVSSMDSVTNNSGIMSTVNPAELSRVEAASLMNNTQEISNTARPGNPERTPVSMNSY